MEDAKRYPLKFTIEFPNTDQALSQYERLTVDKMYEISKEIVEKGGKVKTRTTFIDGSADETNIEKVKELYELFNKQ